MSKSYRKLTIKLAPDESLTFAQNWVDYIFYGKD
jgi:hypothetical protein